MLFAGGWSVRRLQSDRKVRTPFKTREVANGNPGQPEGKCHRDYTNFAQRNYPERSRGVPFGELRVVPLRGTKGEKRQGV